jgi:hypothetical protein
MRSFVNEGVDPRDERLLHWRFHFADGEMWAYGSAFDLRTVAIVRRVRRIDTALARCSRLTREVLFRAYGARPDAALERLSPPRFVEAGVLIIQPLLCNLVELVPEAEQLHAQSGSSKPLRQWLERLSAKSAAGHGDRGALAAILEGAAQLLRLAGEEYALAKTKKPPARTAVMAWTPPARRPHACWVDCPHDRGACLGAQRSHRHARQGRDAAQVDRRRAWLQRDAELEARRERDAVRAVVAFLRWGAGRKKRKRSATAA